MFSRRALHDDRGATAVEYGLIAALIAVVILVAVVLLGSNLGGVFTGSANALGNAATPVGGGGTGGGGTGGGGTGGGGGGGGGTDCAALSLATQAVSKNTGSSRINVMNGVTGGTLLTAVASGEGSIQFDAGGQITWTFPPGNRDVSITFTYSASSCSNGSGSVSLSAR